MTDATTQHQYPTSSLEQPSASRPTLQHGKKYWYNSSQQTMTTPSSEPAHSSATTTTSSLPTKAQSTAYGQRLHPANRIATFTSPPSTSQQAKKQGQL